ncbi:hypothetical protein JCM3770_006090 [Rhodotorula araucariae]
MIRTTLVRSALPMRPRPRLLPAPSPFRSTTSSAMTPEPPVVFTFKDMGAASAGVAGIAAGMVGLAGWAYSGLRNDLSTLEKAQHGLDKTVDVGFANINAKVDVGFAKVDVQLSRLEATLVAMRDMITDRDRYASQAEVSNMYRLINVNRAGQQAMPARAGDGKGEVNTG